MALNFVYAEGQPYIYVSDIIKENKNDNNMKKPFTFQNSNNLYQPRHRYLSPPPKLGSNPITNQQHQYQLIPNNTNRAPYVQKHHYRYPPPIQKLGSNPFIKSSE